MNNIRKYVAIVVFTAAILTLLSACGEKGSGGHYSAGSSFETVEATSSQTSPPADIPFVVDEYAGTPEDAADASWWGTYRSDTTLLGIVNYSGKSFRFTFYGDGESEFEGVAAVFSDNVFQAEYMDLVFALSQDSNTVTVTQNKENPQAVFAGEYHREADAAELLSQVDAEGLVWQVLEEQGKEGLQLVGGREDTIDGEHAILIIAGNTSADGKKFTGMYHFAVTDSGKVYYMDPVQGPDWQLVKENRNK